MEDLSHYRVLCDRTQDDPNWPESSRWREKMRWIRVTSLLVAGATMASIFWIFGLCIHPSFPRTSAQTLLRAIPSSSPTRHCGSTPNEARMNGCQFQLWSYSWVPSPCFDHGLQKSFIDIAISSEGWSYYSSPAEPEDSVLDLGIVMGGGKDNIFTTWGQHYWHCVMYQRKFFSMVLGSDGTNLDMMTNRDKNEPHALSCQRWLADPNAYDWREVNVNLTIGYNTC